MTDVVGAALPVEGNAPDWVHLVPAGQFRGVDGRGPYRADPAALVASFQVRAKPRPLVLDFAHQTHTAVRSGHAAPAAGWIVELQAREDGVWGRVEWTPAGQKALADKEYRFISPVFAYAEKTGGLTQILAAGLVNNPNLDGLAPVVNGAQRSAEEVETITVESLLRKARDESAQDRFEHFNK